MTWILIAIVVIVASPGPSPIAPALIMLKFDTLDQCADAASTLRESYHAEKWSLLQPVVCVNGKKRIEQ